MSGNMVNSIFWLAVLILVSFWISTFCFIPYLIVSVLTPCLPALKPLSDILLAAVTFPAKCSDNMMNGRGCDSL